MCPEEKILTVLIKITLKITCGDQTSPPIGALFAARNKEKQIVKYPNLVQIGPPEHYKYQNVSNKTLDTTNLLRMQSCITP